MKTGRPTKYKGIDADPVRKVIEGLRMDFTVAEACAYGNISRDTFYAWKREYGEFSDQIDSAQLYLGIIAKKTLANALQTESTFKSAMQYLERRQPERYSQKRSFEMSREKIKPVYLTIKLHKSAQ